MILFLFKLAAALLTLSIVICLTGRYARWCDIGLHHWEAPGEPCIDCGEPDTFFSEVDYSEEAMARHSFLNNSGH